MKSGSGAVNVAFAWAKVFPPAQVFEKRSDVFRILMPTAPARIKLLPTRCQCVLVYRPRPLCLDRTTFSCRRFVFLLNPKFSAVRGNKMPSLLFAGRALPLKLRNYLSSLSFTASTASSALSATFCATSLALSSAFSAASWGSNSLTSTSAQYSSAQGSSTGWERRYSR